MSNIKSKPKVVVLPLVLERELSALPYLALGMLTAYARNYKDGMLEGAYNINRVLVAGHEGAPLKTIYGKVTQSPNPVCLFSSYVWNHALNIKAAKHIKAISPGSMIIFGGPHVPKYQGETESFLRENPFVDVAVIGEGELALAEILDRLDARGRTGTLFWTPLEDRFAETEEAVEAAEEAAEAAEEAAEAAEEAVEEATA